MYIDREDVKVAIISTVVAIVLAAFIAIAYEVITSEIAKKVSEMGVCGCSCSCCTEPANTDVS